MSSGETYIDSMSSGETNIDSMSSGETNIDCQRQRFQAFCKERCANWKDQTSKTISQERGQQIVRLLKKDPVAVNCSSQFKFWVKKRGFELINYPPIGLNDVLCFPSKKKVGSALNASVALKVTNR